MTKRFVLTGLAVVFSGALAVAQTSKEESVGSVVAACKSDCPKAKSDEEAHKCAEKKGRLNKDFRKTKCWEVNEEYEKKAGEKSEAH